MGLLCCKYNNQQSKQKIVPTFRKHQHISFSILQLELSQYNTIRRKYRQRKKKQARLRRLEKENRNKIVKETESKENESDIPSDGLEQTKNASHLYREKIYALNMLHHAYKTKQVNRWKDQLSKQKLLDAARELEYQTNCRRHHLTLSNQLTDEQAHACQDIHESAWGL
jgi:hypothetical protein